MGASSISITITGSGGAGVMTAGNALLEAAARAGWYGCMSRSTGPQIRGGEAAAMLRLTTQPVESPDDHYQILMAIDWLNVERFAAEIPLGADSLVLGDPQAGELPAFLERAGAKYAQLPLKDVARSIPHARPNMVALGAVATLIGIPLSSVIEALGSALTGKGAEIEAASAAAVQAGAELARDLPAFEPLAPGTARAGERLLISGNEAAGLGAVRGGVRFVAAYPITPATELLEWLAPALARCGGALVQAEDELAAINQIIGASFGGTPALTATSGPGLALTLESIGLAVAAEVPIVVVDVMRGGPSTGIPTKSEQADLNMALYGLHGDAPHLVLAPTSISDCLFTLQWTVHLAERLQAPAIVLSDQALGQSRAVIRRPAELAFLARRNVAEVVGEGYKRYALVSGGVSPMTLPGTPGGQYTADGLAHDERGTPSSQAAHHAAQLDKRRRKLEDFDYGEHWAVVEGDGDTAVLTWGSTTGPVREAVGRLRQRGQNVRLVALRLLAPAQPQQLAAAVRGVRRALIVEQSHGGQFYRYLRAFYDLPRELKVYARPGPLPLRPGDIQAQIEDWG